MQRMQAGQHMCTLQALATHLPTAPAVLSVRVTPTGHLSPCFPGAAPLRGLLTARPATAPCGAVGCAAAAFAALATATLAAAYASAHPAKPARASGLP